MDRLIKTRAAYVGHVTRFQRALQSATADEFDILTLQARHESFASLRDKFDTVQDEIELLAADDKGDEQVLEREKFETEYYAAEARYRRIVAEYQNANHDSMNRSHGFYAKTVKLPTIKLPQFDGDVTAYESFRNVFDSLINDNEQLTDTQKFIYLRSALIGDALQIISSLAVTNDNYDEALALLDDRYKNVRNVLQAHLKNLFNLPIVKTKSVSTLRSLIDQVNKSLSALKAMKQPVDHWDTMVVYIVMSKIDSESRELFEIGFTEARMPTLQEVLSFLNNRCISFECLLTDSGLKEKGKQFKSLNTTMSRSPSGVEKCLICSSSHKIYKCPLFLSWSPNSRFETVKKKNLCLKCLGSDHKFKDCVFKPCFKCNQDHNHLLHFESTSKRAHEEISPTVPIGNSSQEKPHQRTENSNTTALHSVNLSSSVLLYTAVVRIRDTSGRFNLIRGIIDPGSQVNVISDRVVKALKLNTHSVCANVNGFGKSIKPMSKYVEVVAYANHSDFRFTFEAFVYSTITDNQPNHNFTACPEFSNLLLADSRYNQSGCIDFLLSNAVYTRLMKPGIVESFGGKLKAINTEIGYLVGGLNQDGTEFSKAVSLSVTHDLPDVSELIQKFWLIEEVPLNRESTDTEVCEKYFESTVERLGSGKFSVKLPFANDNFDFSLSRSFAFQRLLSLEKRFRSQPKFKSEYVNFMRDYLKLDHMRLVPESSRCDASAYYIPHHGVMNLNSSTTKLRVVFDGSSSPHRTSSLNSVLHAGPKLQNDIMAILLRFRFYRYCFIADIQKMYRMIEVHEDHRRYQRILWREDESTPIEEYELKTVTYGLKSSPYLALRCLRKLAEENDSSYEKASRIIRNDMFVDDLVSGFDEIEEGKEVLSDIVAILKSATFVLHKWKSNSSNLVAAYSECAPSDTECDFTAGISRILGICWNPKLDQLLFTFALKSTQPSTKRTILSNLAGIFDPLGWISPCVIRGKFLMQQLWESKLDWDQEIHSDLQSKWNEFFEDLNHHQLIRFDRFVGVSSEKCFELIGFSDASMLGYGACVYVQLANERRLLMSKSKVAPVKDIGKLTENLSIARIELLAAVLLCRLMKFILDSLVVKPVRCRLFTDSKIVLAWIRKPASAWKLFVSNRVAEIQRTFDFEFWRYIPSTMNPADLISRGCCLKKLHNSSLWWHGPEVLPDDAGLYETHMEIRKASQVSMSLSLDYLCKFSSYRTRVHVMAFVLRFVHNCKSTPSHRMGGLLKPQEIDSALNTIIRALQCRNFSSTIERLKSSKKLRSRDPLISLHPFLDDEGCLRVGGRLKNSEIPYSAKHPLILPKAESFVKLLIDYEHKVNEHCGVDTLITLLRQKYWVVNARSTVKGVIRLCARCFKSKPSPANQLTGNLPSCRVRTGYVFETTGIDYCGPFLVRPLRGRGNTTSKCYVAVFVCFTTRAVHLEIVFDLTAESFLATIRRFISRRGKPKEIWTDNGTYFVGANRRLKEMYEFLSSDSTQTKIQSTLLDDQIEWKFIPARTPSFGGLWERTIRSMKTILHKLILSTPLSIEEFVTVLNQVEMCLNSRPLGTISNSSDNLDVLTPGHFLVGRHLKALPQPRPPSNLPLGERWRTIQNIFDDFWSRWSKEYLSLLNQRHKNKNVHTNVRIGDLGLVVDELRPPLEWHLGKVVNVFPGNDGLVRAVDIKCGQSILRRGVHKFCPLPDLSEADIVDC